MSTIFICKDCTYYNLTLEAIETHETVSGHEWKVIHTTTDLEGLK
jgi:azurin